MLSNIRINVNAQILEKTPRPYFKKQSEQKMCFFVCLALIS